MSGLREALRSVRGCGNFDTHSRAHTTTTTTNPNFATLFHPFVLWPFAHAQQQQQQQQQKQQQQQHSHTHHNRNRMLLPLRTAWKPRFFAAGRATAAAGRRSVYGAFFLQGSGANHSTAGALALHSIVTTSPLVGFTS
jgi:hypothetical protein